MSASTPRITSEPPIVVADSQIPPSFTAAINHNRQQHHPNQIHANPGHPAPLRKESRHPDGDFDMAVDEDHRTSSSPGRSTIAYCKSCGAEFGEFYNSWSKVTGSYYLPCMVGSYRCTGLRPKSKPKAASPESALVECFIQPLVCDHCDDTLGIVCTSAPEGKKQYAERDFFKLPKIELKSDVTGQIVEAIIEGGQLEASHYQEPSVLSGRTIMEPPLENSATHARKYSAPLMPNHTSPTQHRPESSDDVRRYEAMASRPIASHPSHQAQKPVYHEREPAPQNRHNERGGSFASPVNGHLHTNGHPGSPRGGYPSNITVKLEAIDRIQTQVNLNRATLETCTRDISRLEGNIVRLQASFGEHFEALRIEIMQSRLNPQPTPAQQGDRLDDEAFAVFSDALSNVQSKVNEVDHLRLQMEMIKRKIKRLEEGHANAPQPPTDRTPYSSGARDSSIHHTPVAQATITPNVPHMTPPSRPEARPLGNYRGHLPSQTPDVVHSSHAAHAESASGGWVSVNHGAKRGLSNGVDGRSDAEDTPIGSPKRPKLAPLEPRHTYEAVPEPEPIRFERMDTDESTSSQSQRQPAEIQNSYPDSTNPSTFIPYTNQMDPEDSWRPESQRAGTAGPVISKLQTTQSSPRGRPRGRGRGGRPRKSLPTDREIITLSTPEWEKDTWAGAQVGPDGFYYAGADRGALIRRGSGGGQGQPLQATSPQSSMGDPYGHAKKTRTKPIRNSDGVLIRKDGRPDMRSQSSAANLRKVHARKEEEKRMEPGSGMSPTSALGTRVTSPDSQNSGEQERTNYALQQMFPHGVEEHRGVLTTAEHYFPSARHSPMETKPLVTQAHSEGSGGSEAPTREPSHFHDQPAREHHPERGQTELHVESAVEVDRDERMEDSPVEPQREDSTQHRHTLQAEEAAPQPALISATNTLQSASTLQTNSTLQSSSTVHSDSTLQASSATLQTQGALSAPGVTAGVTA